MWQGRQRASRLWCGVPYCDLHEAEGSHGRAGDWREGLRESFLKEVM